LRFFVRIMLLLDLVLDPFNRRIEGCLFGIKLSISEVFVDVVHVVFRLVHDKIPCVAIDRVLSFVVTECCTQKEGKKRALFEGRLCVYDVLQRQLHY
jgi:hypothetical protein